MEENPSENSPSENPESDQPEDLYGKVVFRITRRKLIEDGTLLDISTTAREAPEYGRASAGTLAIRPENGTDQFRFTATNFIPGLDTHDGVNIGDWTPRAGFSGPLVLQSTPDGRRLYRAMGFRRTTRFAVYATF